MSQSSPLRVAYLVSRYPAPSHVFIEREILGLRERGVEVVTFSVRPAPPDTLLSAHMRVEAETTTVLLADKPALAASTRRLATRHPAAYAGLLGLVRRSGAPGARSRTWQLFYLTEAARLWEEMSRLGLRHLHVHFSNVAADVARYVVEIGRAVDGPDAGWCWTITVHGPTEFEDVVAHDLPAKYLHADAVATISDFARSQVMRLLPVTSWTKLHQVRMGVDTTTYQPAAPSSQDAGGTGHPLRILSVGRLVPEKGATVLLEAVASLCSRGMDLRVRIVGQGPLRAELEERVRHLGLAGTVELLGPRGQDELPGLYRWADLFALPSFQEGLPVVLMEALASGLPVVTTRIAAIPELVTEDMGRVVSPGRADLFADALDELASDPGLRRSMGLAGRAAVERQYARAVVAEQMLAFLRAASPAGSAADG